MTGISPSPTRSALNFGSSSRSRGRSSGNANEQSSRASSAKSPGAKPPIAPTLTSGSSKAKSSGRPNSLVRDTIRLFDAKTRNRIPMTGGAVVGKYLKMLEVFHSSVRLDIEEFNSSDISRHFIFFNVTDYPFSHCKAVYYNKQK